MGKLLLVTTRADLSLPLLHDAALRLGWDFISIFFEDDVATGDLLPIAGSASVVYFRDPFNVGVYDESHIVSVMEAVTKSQEQAYFVDDVKHYSDLLFEDKLAQYQQLSTYMPRTTILENTAQFVPGQNIIKKRISARAKDVHFEFSDEYLDGRYVVQPLLLVAEEYRVFTVCGKVLGTAGVRTPKTPTSKVKVSGVTELASDIKQFAEEVVSILPWLNFGGLDIVRTQSGELFLIEVNRSCQFFKYSQLSGQDIASELLASISKKAAKTIDNF